MKKLLNIPNLLILLTTAILYSCGGSQEIQKKRMTVTTNSEEARELFVGVHGGRSEGYEWIYPLKTIDTKKKEMYFISKCYFWNFQNDQKTVH